MFFSPGWGCPWRRPWVWAKLLMFTNPENPPDTVSHRLFNNNCGHIGTQGEPLGSCDRWWTGENDSRLGWARSAMRSGDWRLGVLTSLLIPPLDTARLLSAARAWLATTNGDAEGRVWKVVQMSCFSSQTSRAHAGSNYWWLKWRRNC